MTSYRLPLLGLAGAAALCTWLAVGEPAVHGNTRALALHAESSRSDEAPPALGTLSASTPRAQLADTPTSLVGDLESPEAGQPGALGDLQDLTSKKIAKAEKALAKKETALEKLEDALDVRETAQSDAQDVLDQAQDDAAQAALDLSDAEQALADALGMPEGTPEELSARKAAIKAAKQAIKAATKAQNQANKLAAAAGKKIAKLGVKIAKLEEKIEGVEDIVADLEDTLDALDGDFDFQSTHVVEMEGEVIDGEGAPLAFAQITVVDKLKAPKKANQLIENEITPAVYWRGFTDENGAFASELRLPGQIDEVDIIVTKAGFRGDYSDEGLRELWGPFAPASRLTFEDDQLAELVIELQENL